MRLLIVEDEKQICDMVAKSLYAAGYEVDTCYDGTEALEYVLAENYDLIVLDLNLPGIDGMDILRELRLWIRLRDLMQGLMTIWKSRFICRSLRHVSEV